MTSLSNTKRSQRAPRWTFRVYADNGDLHWSRPLERRRCRFTIGRGIRCGAVTALVHPYCAACLPAALRVTIKSSTVRRAGLGLFACDPGRPKRAVVFRAGDFIAPYLGEQISDAKLAHRYFDAVSDRSIEYIRTPYGAGNGRTHVDGAIFRGPAVYSNDAKGTRRQANARIRRDRSGAVGLYARRVIRNGDEIFTRYGARYWEAYPVEFETVLV